MIIVSLIIIIIIIILKMFMHNLFPFILGGENTILRLQLESENAILRVEILVSYFFYIGKW
jgi:hypothetical protein